MPITQIELARRLRSARKACRGTQAEAARVLGISRSAVSQMESGRRGVSGLELHRLAHLYACDIREFLDDRFEDASPVATMFGAHPELRNSLETMESLRRSGQFHRELTNLHEILGPDHGLPLIPAYPPTGAEGKKRFRARFLALAIEAYTRDAITRRKLDELGCMVDVDDLSRRLAGVGRHLA